MTKRKSNPCLPNSSRPVSLGSFDAALDLLAAETFGRLESLTEKFEVAAGVELDPGAVKNRWEEAVKRYWLTKSMEECCMSMANGSSTKGFEDLPVDRVEGIGEESSGELDW